jgi:hypothetical protein
VLVEAKKQYKEPSNHLKQHPRHHIEGSFLRMTKNAHDRRGFLKALLIGVVTLATLPLLAPPAAADDELDDFDANAQGGKKVRKSRRTRTHRTARRGRKRTNNSGRRRA